MLKLINTGIFLDIMHCSLGNIPYLCRRKELIDYSIMNKEETKQLFESIMAEVAVIVKRKIEEHFGSPVGSESPETASDDELDESYVSPLEKENERFVEQVC